jgi:hypothetical protein
MKYLFVLLLLCVSCGSPCEEALPVVQPIQLINNGGFEEFNPSSTDPIPYWLPVNCPFDTTKVYVTKNSAYTENFSLQLFGLSCGTNTKVSVPESVTNYALTMNVKLVTGLGVCSQCARTTIRWFSSTGDKLKVDTYYTSFGNWHLEKMTGTIPSNASSVDVELLNTAEVGYHAQIYVDDVSLVVE